MREGEVHLVSDIQGDRARAAHPLGGPRRAAAPGAPEGAPEGGRESLGTTYEITSPSKGAEVGEGHVRRLGRYRLQSAARAVLPESRLAVCHRWVVGSQAVEVWSTEERAHYRNLMTCGSVWVCPVCAARITEVRRLELSAAVERWRAKGGIVVLLTQTIPHHAWQPLGEVLTGFQRARSFERRQKRWRRIKEEAGLAGTIRALEVTVGPNGWHPHCHELLFLRGVVDLVELERLAAASWIHACEAVSLERPNGHGARLHDGTYAAEYASKWGLVEEVTKAHVKRARGENLGPWGLLELVAEDGDARAADLFREYGRCFHGRRQMVWTKGLRALLGLHEERTDEELAEGVDLEAARLGALTREEWKLVRDAEKRGEVLEAAQAEGWPGVLRLVAALTRRSEGSAPTSRPGAAGMGRGADSGVNPWGTV